MKPSISIILRDNGGRKSGLYPIKLRITFDRKAKYYQINDYSVTEQDFKKIMGEKPREEHIKEIKYHIVKTQNEAEEIIRKLQYFTFDIFEKEFLLGKKKADTNIFNWLDNTYKDLFRQERIKTAELYSYAHKSLLKFTKKSELSFYDISVDFLREYEIWFTENQGNSLTTLGIYLRNIRVIFNLAIADGVIVKNAYPFGRRKYIIPSTKNTKKALPIKDIEKIFKHSVIEFSSEDKWKDYWFLSYLCNGANIKDLCTLKWKTVSENKITFLRSKTKSTSRNELKVIEVPLTEEIRQIMAKWCNKDTDSNSYVFPILSHEMNAKKKADVIHQIIKNINKYIKQIALDEGINKKVTTYTARHSFATVLKRSGVSTEFISESIGHADLKTTENYLDSFEDEMKEEVAKKLLDFGKTKKKRPAGK